MDRGPARQTVIAPTRPQVPPPEVALGSHQSASVCPAGLGGVSSEGVLLRTRRGVRAGGMGGPPAGASRAALARPRSTDHRSVHRRSVHPRDIQPRASSIPTTSSALRPSVRLGTTSRTLSSALERSWRLGPATTLTVTETGPEIGP